VILGNNLPLVIAVMGMQVSRTLYTCMYRMIAEQSQLKHASMVWGHFTTMMYNVHILKKEQQESDFYNNYRIFQSHCINSVIASSSAVHCLVSALPAYITNICAG